MKPEKTKIRKVELQRRAKREIEQQFREKSNRLTERKQSERSALKREPMGKPESVPEQGKRSPE